MLHIKIAILLVFSILGSCTSQNISEHKLVKNEIASFLWKNGHIDDGKHQQYLETGEGFTIDGFYNHLFDSELIDGVYRIDTSSHSLVFFFIYENKKVDILDISNFSGLLEAIEKVVNYSNKNKFCYEITNDYVLRLMATYYTGNKNLKNYRDPNCEFQTDSKASAYKISEISLELAEFLVDKKEIKDRR